MADKKLHPIIKWVGSKLKLVEKLYDRFPDSFGDYYEPFLGSGIVFMTGVNKNILSGKKCYLSDMLDVLIHTYMIVRNYPDELIQELNNNTYIYDKAVYEEKKAEFNILKLKSDCTEKEKITLGALFIYLNKCGFNGMYRENKKGLFNIPFGRYTNPKIFSVEELKTLSEKLKTTSLQRCPYQVAIENAKAGDMVYLDPPYDATFHSYTKSSFGREDQIKLKQVVDDLTTRGCFVMMSNSATSFIKDLYKEYTVEVVQVTRPINSNSKKRKDVVEEVIIRNY